MPSGNDRRLFELILNHYDDVAFQRLVKLDVRKPHYGLKSVVQKAKSVYMALEELQHLAYQADELVIALDGKFQDALRRSSKPNIEHMACPEDEGLVENVVDSTFPASVKALPKEKRSGKRGVHASKSLSAVEEELMRPRHGRAATAPETMHVPDVDLSVRRRGTNVPRIFTGSFSQLESDLRKLELDKVITPTSPNIEELDEAIKICDFGSAALSPCTTQSSQPLQRREALVSKDIEFRDRVINGEVVRSRRPSNKAVRVQATGDSSIGVEAWLKETPSESSRAASSGLIRRHGSL